MAMVLPVSLALSACAVNSEIAVATSGTTLPGGSALVIAEPAKGAALEAGFAASLAEGLSGKGFTVTQDGPYLVQYGIAVRDASVALLRADEVAGVEVVSPARRSYLLDQCKAQHLRLQVAAIEQLTGKPVRKATLAMNGCDFSAEDMAQLASVAADRLSAN
ncbi:MAG: hypothetical protein KDD98_09325 [Sphingomonadaceae bacterium]|nr:hypothetical protein [Sphingomonadaceae bacterium]